MLDCSGRPSPAATTPTGTASTMRATRRPGGTACCSCCAAPGRVPRGHPRRQRGVPWLATAPTTSSPTAACTRTPRRSIRGVEWRGLWDAYRTSLSKVSRRPAYHFIQADVRADQRTQATATGLRALTENDHRRLRLGLATRCCWTTGISGSTGATVSTGQLWWFDEYNVDLGAPLGRPSRGATAPARLPATSNAACGGQPHRDCRVGLGRTGLAASTEDPGPKRSWCHPTMRESFLDLASGPVNRRPGTCWKTRPNRTTHENTRLPLAGSPCRAALQCSQVFTTGALWERGGVRSTSRSPSRCPRAGLISFCFRLLVRFHSRRNRETASPAPGIRR